MGPLPVAEQNRSCPNSSPPPLLPASREPDPAIKEPLAAIIHAAPRIELREMHQLREMLMQKYGRDFAVAAMENTDGSVSERVTSRLRIETPGRDLVDMYIAESA